MTIDQAWIGPQILVENLSAYKQVPGDKLNDFWLL